MNPKKDILYKKLEDHFNQAAQKSPAHAFTFREELGIYKGALLDDNPLCQEILRLRTMPGMDASCRPEEVVDVFKKGFQIYKGQG